MSGPRWVVEIIREANRQHALTHSLGQVQCAAPEGYDYYVVLGRACDHCGAAL